VPSRLFFSLNSDSGHATIPAKYEKSEERLKEDIALKVPKCENFHRTDFFYFFTIKPIEVGNFRAKNKNSKF
jgi:hypothetical protein